MNTVYFDDVNSYEDWGLTLKTKKRPKPKPKTNYVSIPGRNGDLDLTEEFGDVFYENLTYPLEFNVVDPLNTWDEKLRIITNYLHGRIRKVTFSEDAGYYYLGRLTVNELASNKALGTLSLSCNFEPYKYKQEVTSISYEVEEGKSYIFSNGRMKVVPTLTLSADMTFKFNDVTYSLSAGTHKALNIQFDEGNNVIEIITGTGTLKAEYQEGDL